MNVLTSTFTDFSGIKAGMHPVLSPAYPYARNLRGREGVAVPVRAHVKLPNPSVTNMQGLFVTGNILVIAGSGSAYYRRLDVDGGWEPIGNWTPMSASAYRVWLTPVAQGQNKRNRTGTRENVEEAFNAGMSTYPRVVVAQDGVSIPNIIHADGTAQLSLTYTEWRLNNPLYIPIAKFGTYARGKSYFSDGAVVFHSVSGRPTDYVVAINEDGSKAGDANTTAYAPVFDDITAVLASPDGNVLVATLYNTVLMTPNGAVYFGEPDLTVQDLFPIGAVSQFAFVNINGDTCFISQTGIHSFNEGRQLRNDSNFTAFSAPIRRILAPVQTERACAIRFDDYALFALDTTEGEKIVVYDCVTNAFVSVDDCPAGIKQFAVSRVAGRQRLFFITDTDVYEAYAGDYVQAEIRFGPFTATKNLRLSHMQLDILDADGAESLLEVNGIRHETEEAVTGTVTTITAAFKPVEEQAISYKILWKGGTLYRISTDLTEVPRPAARNDLILEDSANYLIIGPDWFGEELVPAGAAYNPDGLYEVPVSGRPSVILGNATAWADPSVRDTEDYKPVNSVWLSGTPGATVTASVRRIALPDVFWTTDYDAIICPGGDVVVAHMALLLTWRKLPAFFTAGHGDVTASFYNSVQRQPRHGWHKSRLLDIGVVSTQLSDPFTLNTNGTLATGTYDEPQGAGPLSVQSKLLRSKARWANFRLLLLPQPSYTDEVDSYPGHVSLRWAWDNIDLFVQGGTNCLELLTEDAKVLISAGKLLATPAASSTAGRADFYASSNGYWILTVSAQRATISCYDVHGAQLQTRDLSRRN